ncbi:MAG: hypothetical protein F9K30_23705 [Dechloromonas sp.]|nr:MAG: hypothetical protein F9K30_23705 [Dechloromonas sp.]
MRPGIFNGVVGFNNTDRTDQIGVLQMNRSLAFLTSLAALMIMPLIGIATLLTYDLMGGWHLLLLFPLEMLAAQFDWVGHVALIAIGSLRTAVTLYFILVTRRWLQVTFVVLGIHALLALLTYEIIYRNGH